MILLLFMFMISLVISEGIVIVYVYDPLVISDGIVIVYVYDLNSDIG